MRGVKLLAFVPNSNSYPLRQPSNLMQQAIDSLQKNFQEKLSSISNLASLEDLKVTFLGKKGAIPSLMIQLKDASPEEKPLLGKAINDLKCQIEELINQAKTALEQTSLHQKLENERIDIHLPGRKRWVGTRHPIQAMLDRMLDVFKSLGFAVQLGPDIDSDYYNFEGMNYPKDHPARDMQDTFYVSPSHLLRSHTSNTQLRIMEKFTPPLRFVAPGTVYRNETVSTRSHVFFHQVEGMFVDKGVTFGDLLSTIDQFYTRLFGKVVETRYRPSFFPFTEPSLEVDIRCTSCGGLGCRLCKQTGWLEVAGAGLIHPEVLKNGGLDPEVYSGFAWGMGVERLTMLEYGISDIRLFAENDLRFLEQFDRT